MSTSDYQELLKRLVAQVERVANALEARQLPIQAVPPADEAVVGQRARVTAVKQANVSYVDYYNQSGFPVMEILDDKRGSHIHYDNGAELLVTDRQRADGGKYYWRVIGPENPRQYVREVDIVVEDELR